MGGRPGVLLLCEIVRAGMFFKSIVVSTTLVGRLLGGASAEAVSNFEIYYLGAILARRVEGRGAAVVLAVVSLAAAAGTVAAVVAAMIQFHYLNC